MGMGLMRMSSSTNEVFVVEIWTDQHLDCISYGEFLGKVLKSSRFEEFL